jgi:TolA-binding protein
MALLQRADGERRMGHLSAARDTLLELRQRFPRGAGAPQAAFDLGVLAFDADGRYADAARWFHLYRDEAPRGPLAREALGRLLEAHSRSGDSEAASSSAALYLEMYPGGPHASLAKRLVAQRP